MSESLHGRIEGYYISRVELSASYFHDANTVDSRLPMFYMNFERKNYMHMDCNRAHEEFAYSDWLAR
ncbi:hypothetical protein Q2389_26810, partial [Escherichia coli]|nr:hypothetical protein [Escherichia coli]